MPYPNESSCRLVSPDKFQPDSFRRIKRGKGEDAISIIIGRLKGKETTQAQAYRYPKDGWTEERARTHCGEAGGTFEPAGESKTLDEDMMLEIVEELDTRYVTPEDLPDDAESLKFAGSPRNRFGTHSSYKFKGSYAAAWRRHFAKIGGGALTGAAGGPIRGTVRRTEMIAAAMKPACSLPGTDGIGPRKGEVGEAGFPGAPSDYGLESWDKPETDADREGVKLSCEDLAVIKRAALAEVKYRAQKREAQEKKKSVDDLHCVKALGQNRFGGYLVLWGDENHKDLTGEYFTPQTEEMFKYFEALGRIPAMYHHGMDDTVKSDVIGIADVMQRDEIGVWVETQYQKASKYREAVAKLIERGSLYWSSGALPGSRKVTESGEIQRWTICDATLTPTPAEHRMLDRPIEAIKATYESIGLTFPDDEGSEATGAPAIRGTGATPAEDAEDARQRAIRTGLGRLQLLELRARSIDRS